MKVNVPEEFQSFYGWIEKTKGISEIYELIENSDTLEKLAMCDELLLCFRDYLNRISRQTVATLGKRGTPTATQIRIINRWRKQLRNEIFT